MPLQLAVYDNVDHACLAWMPVGGQRLDGCLGFIIERTLDDVPGYVHGWVGFVQGVAPATPVPNNYPIQRFMWADYGVKPGDRVRYAVVPVMGTAPAPVPDYSQRSTPSQELTIGANASQHISAYFNRGIVATQWVSRAMAAQPAKASLKTLVADPSNSLRKELGGLLLPKVLELLATTRAAGDSLYVALYELGDTELVNALTGFGPSRCHLILGNGAFKTDTPPGNDENAAIRAAIRSKVDLSDRIVRAGHFAHNKFVVFCKADGTPYKVLTGSLNWTSSGLCTQANNSLVIDDATVARQFKSAWDRLKAAGNGYPPDLIVNNSVTSTTQVDDCQVTPWFAATSAAQELVRARQLIEAATDGILFLFFNPGVFEKDPAHETLLQTIVERRKEPLAAGAPPLYFCGVVNQNIAQLTTDNPNPVDADTAASDPTKPAPVTLYDSTQDAPQPLSHDVLVPQAIKANYAEWEKELRGASSVIIHSKVIVLDPFGTHPVVMTGSHNMGYKASSANDDNLVIIEGNGPLAAAYAVNIVAIFQNFRWNDYATRHAADTNAWHGLSSSDRWQDGYLTDGGLRELDFWLHAGQPPRQVPQPPQPAGA